MAALLLRAFDSRDLTAILRTAEDFRVFFLCNFVQCLFFSGTGPSGLELLWTSNWGLRAPGARLEKIL